MTTLSANKPGTLQLFAAVDGLKGFPAPREPRPHSPRLRQRPTHSDVRGDQAVTSASGDDAVARRSIVRCNEKLVATKTPAPTRVTRDAAERPSRSDSVPAEACIASLSSPDRKSVV